MRLGCNINGEQDLRFKVIGVATENEIQNKVK